MSEFFHKSKIKLTQIFIKPTTEMIAFNKNNKRIGNIVDISDKNYELLFEDESRGVYHRKELIFIVPKFKVGDSIQCRGIPDTLGVITSIERKFVHDGMCVYKYNIDWNNSVSNYMFEQHIEKVKGGHS
jgi:hypothetical protein